LLISSIILVAVIEGLSSTPLAEGYYSLIFILIIKLIVEPLILFTTINITNDDLSVSFIKTNI